MLCAKWLVFMQAGIWRYRQNQAEDVPLGGAACKALSFKILSFVIELLHTGYVI